MLVDRRLERRAAARGAAVVELEDHEAAIGEVLPQEVRRPLVAHELHARPAVDHHDHRVALARLDRARLEDLPVERVAGVALHRHDLR